jgi:hypothetical protein
MARTTRTTTKPSDPVAALTAQVAALAEMVAALTAGTTAPNPVPAKATRTRKAPTKAKAAKVYSWKPWACAKFGIPAIEGASFAYNGKNATTDHVVTKVDTDGTVHSVRA